MSWSSRNYPLSMKSLQPSVRSRAIKIANDLAQAGMSDGSAVDIAVAKARKVAR